MGETSVRNLVARLKVEIGVDRRQVMVPLTHPPAVEAEVDFGEFTAANDALLEHHVPRTVR